MGSPSPTLPCREGVQRVVFLLFSSPSLLGRVGEGLQFLSSSPIVAPFLARVPAASDWCLTRPTPLSRTRHVGVLATEGTVRSRSYDMEITKLYPDITVTGVACPMWVPLIENNEYDTPGADYFVKKRLDAIMQADPEIDTIILGCTHYPLLLDKILKYTPRGVRIVPQGEYVAASLKDYLARHPEIDEACTRHATCRYLTTENKDKFNETARIFMREPVCAGTISLV